MLTPRTMNRARLEPNTVKDARKKKYGRQCEGRGTGRRGRPKLAQQRNKATR